MSPIPTWVSYKAMLTRYGYDFRERAKLIQMPGIGILRDLI